MASRMLGNRSGSSMLNQAVNAIRAFGASDAMMNRLYNSNPQIRQIVDSNRGMSIDDLLRSKGVDPDEARRLLGISR